jgi:DNA replication protein DnaC
MTSSDKRSAALRPPRPCRVCGAPSIVGPDAPLAFANLRCGRAGAVLNSWPSERNHPAKTLCVRCLGQRAERYELAAVRWELHRTLDERLMKAGVPEILQGAAFKTCDEETPADALAKSKGWAQRPAGCLYFAGETGVGKSWLAACVLRDWMRRHRDGWWCSVRDVVDRLQKPRGRPGRGWNGPDLDALAAAPLVVVDDLGAECGLDWIKGKVYGLLVARYEHMLPVVITSNMSLRQVSETLDDRLASRLSHDALVLTLDGADRRLQRVSRGG